MIARPKGIAVALTSETTHHDADPEASAPDVEAPEARDEEPLAEDDLLLEEISIDGMCGVY